MVHLTLNLSKLIFILCIVSCGSSDDGPFIDPDLPPLSTEVESYSWDTSLGKPVLHIQLKNYIFGDEFRTKSKNGLSYGYRGDGLLIMGNDNVEDITLTIIAIRGDHKIEEEYFFSKNGSGKKEKEK